MFGLYLAAPVSGRGSHPHLQLVPQPTAHQWSTSPQLTLGTAMIISTTLEIIADLTQYVSIEFEPYLIQVVGYIFPRLRGIKISCF